MILEYWTVGMSFTLSASSSGWRWRTSAPSVRQQPWKRRHKGACSVCWESNEQLFTAGAMVFCLFVWCGNGNSGDSVGCEKRPFYLKRISLKNLVLSTVLCSFQKNKILKKCGCEHWTINYRDVLQTLLDIAMVFEGGLHMWWCLL